jgi:hypothetical protein
VPEPDKPHDEPSQAGFDHTLWFPAKGPLQRAAFGGYGTGEPPTPPLDSEAVRGMVERALPYLPGIREDLAIQEEIREDPDDRIRLAFGAVAFAVLSRGASFKQAMEAYKNLVDLTNSMGYESLWRFVDWGNYKHEMHRPSHEAFRWYTGEVRKRLLSIYDAVSSFGRNAYGTLASNLFVLLYLLPLDKSEEDVVRYSEEHFHPSSSFIRVSALSLAERLGRYWLPRSVARLALQLYDHRFELISLDRYMMVGVDIAFGGPGHTAQPAEQYGRYERWYLDLLRYWRDEKEALPADTTPFMWQYALWLSFQGVGFEPLREVFLKAKGLILPREAGRS